MAGIREDARGFAARACKIGERTVEFFADRRTPATLMAIARALKAPPSSTFALLRSLCDLVYLSCDRSMGAFVPTLRAALPGIWVNDLFSHADATPLAHARLAHENAFEVHSAKPFI